MTVALLLLGWGFLIGFLLAWFLQGRTITKLRTKNTRLYYLMRARNWEDR